MADEGERRGKDRKDNDARGNEEDGVGRHFGRLLRLDEGASRSRSAPALIGVNDGQGGGRLVAGLIGSAIRAEVALSLRIVESLQPSVFGMVRYAHGVVQVNFDAALTTEFAIKMHGSPMLHASDFIL